ncbi:MULTISPECIES: heat-inducible transcriptional repressor HrcA [Devosia]|jgi:heat-inducible transcriptional repressor|uniref:Heat-inducible transcription repressor HrcA n=1 Tax=Devosia litorisediminis TaxID=2829817 RepID=A0A942EDF8_9HYPH|nr:MULTISPECIES: heat-inducible transcriptional repressor HrcA [Devosia]MBS3850409.1 heat-inducible transcriptional repressor HrcA [Devosia litorisediminis]MCZ4347452.1 heat-inducible transcriptional repressor HrcA [Devosia neptuniae]|tara:strand:+ start:3722 stop:4795 length:1074 start_codon:yes stop_codon:yes gene_type:complete
MSKLPEDFLSVLNARSQDIFRKIVERYLDTGAPVGSRDLSRMLQGGLSPASVRNVMADLEDLGLIAAPHTSAGRAPTQDGLRFFVDAMLEVGAVNEIERSQIAQSIQGQQRGQVEDVLTEASQLLSGLSHGAGVVITAKADMVLRHLEFVRLDNHRAMAILVGEDGQVENRILETPPGLTASALTQAGNYIAHHVVGRTLAEARKVLAAQRAQQRAELDELTQKLVDAGIATLSQSSPSNAPTVIVRGRANLINDTMASDELLRMRQLFDELESKDGLLDLLGDADKAQGVRIFIGSENKLFSLSGSSVILSPYKDANDKVVGVLGVIGPTRLNYARIVPVVDYTAHVITAMMARKR